MIYSRVPVPAGSFLKIAGELLDDALLQGVTVTQELNTHSWCEVRCRQTEDKRFPAEDFLGTDLIVSAFDEQGSEVEIFQGFVLESELEFEISGSQTARLRAVSLTYAMDLNRRREYYFQKKPQEVAQMLVARSGLELEGEVDGQKLSFVQMEETDFRFLLRFADANEKWLRPSEAGVEVRSAFQPGVKLAWRGEFGLVQFSVMGKLAARRMAGEHYDYRKMQSEVLGGVQDDAALYGSASKMTGAAGAQSSSQMGTGFMTARDRLLGVEDLSPRLKKEARRAHAGMVLCRGVSREQRLRAGDEVTVDGVLDTKGTYGLVKVWHKWSPAGYENEFLCTPAKRYSNAEAVPVARFDGVVPARVADNDDPEEIGRIQVQYYWQEDSYTCWVRTMTPYAGADRGIFNLPEIGDEVWVMFEEGDPERGRVLGSAWNGVMQPPREELWGGDVGPNDVKRMVTKSGHRITLDDKPGKNAIVVATPKHVKMSLMESSNETGDAMLALHSDGDVILSAPAGRIHFHSKFWSREVGSGGGAAHASGAAVTPVSKPMRTAGQVGPEAKVGASLKEKTTAPFDCGAAWKNCEDQADKIIKTSNDPVARNKAFNAAYAKMYLENPKLEWLGAAAFASKQVGCGLKDASDYKDIAEADRSPWNPNGASPVTQIQGAYAETVYKALGEGNKAVFKDIYPAHLFYKQYGLQKMKQCANARTPRLDKKVLDGFAEIDAGHSASGAQLILRHEQLDILQADNVFGNQELVNIMKINQWASQHWYGRLFGAQPTRVSFTPECTGDPSVTFSGTNPADPTERWPYAKRVVETFDKIKNDPQIVQGLNTIARNGP